MNCTMEIYDVVVVGGGQAGLSAAISAAETGVSVSLLEASSKTKRGGNSRHARNLRPMHEGQLSIMEGSYPEDEYWNDLMQVTEGNTNEALARVTLLRSVECVGWMEQRGVEFRKPLKKALHLDRTNAFFLGGGRELMESLYRYAESIGVHIFYETEVVDCQIDGSKFKWVVAISRGKQRYFTGRSLIAAAGGFEANIEWLKESWGEAAENFLIRGTEHNKGLLLRSLLKNGAQQVGESSQCHAVAIDGRAPKYDGGIDTRVDCVSLGIVVNRDGKRFYDEGEDFWPKRYAIWGRLVAQQPDQIAYAIVDDQTRDAYMAPAYPPDSADTLEELAQIIGMDPSLLIGTIDEYNRSVQPGEFDHKTLDNCSTSGLAVNKSHWARTIDKGPFSAFILRPGITFTYMGVAVTDKAQVKMADGSISENIFATGEIMSGNVLGQGYLAGIGITIGNVFGRIAGTEAGNYLNRINHDSAEGSLAVDKNSPAQWHDGERSL